MQMITAGFMTTLGGLTTSTNKLRTRGRIHEAGITYDGLISRPNIAELELNNLTIIELAMYVCMYHMC